MSRGVGYGGGQSSLGYLFGSEEQPASAPPPSPVIMPPYGIDTSSTERPSHTSQPSNEHGNVSNNYHRAQGQNAGNFLTVSFSELLDVFDFVLFHFAVN